MIGFEGDAAAATFFGTVRGRGPDHLLGLVVSGDRHRYRVELDDRKCGSRADVGLEPRVQTSISDSGAPGTEGPDQVTVIVSPDPFVSCRARPSADHPVERGNFTVKYG